MALVKCPECSAEVSHAATSCPHCGYPLIAEASPKKRFAFNPKVIVALILVVVVCAVSFLAYRTSVRNSIRKAYIDNLDDIRIKMYATVIFSEELAQLTHDVWLNTIEKKNDRNTNPYTVQNYAEDRYYYTKSEFYNDFNLSLRALAAAPETRAKIEVIRDYYSEISAIFAKLQNPPDDLTPCYAVLNEMYDSFQVIVDCAISPSGSLTTYTATFREADTSFVNSFKKLDAIIPLSDMVAISDTALSVPDTN